MDPIRLTCPRYDHEIGLRPSRVGIPFHGFYQAEDAAKNARTLLARLRLYVSGQYRKNQSAKLNLLESFDGVRKTLETQLFGKNSLASQAELFMRLPSAIYFSLRAPLLVHRLLPVKRIRGVHPA